MYSEEKYSGFAKEFIAGRNLASTSDFPFDIWKNMGDNGFFENHDPQVLNGESTKFRNLSRASYALAKDGGCVGFVLSFLIHEIISGFILRRFGNTINRSLFKEISKGGIISFAVSEPESGAHPKYMKTRAVKDGDSYIINGTKAYLTNGPIADHFIVVAMTSDDSVKKFTAFYLPADTKGLTKTEPMDIPFFKPSPHGGIDLKECRVKKENIIGTIDSAWDEIVLPFNIIENSLMSAVVAGAVEKQLELLVMGIDKSNADEKVFLNLGELKSIQDTLLILASEMAKHADNYGFFEEHFSILLFFRKTSDLFQQKAKNLVEEMNIKTCKLYNDIKNDLEGSSKIGSGTIMIRQRKLGENLIFNN